jgi:hypothetical protein
MIVEGCKNTQTCPIPLFKMGFFKTLNIKWKIIIMLIIIQKIYILSIH